METANSDADKQFLNYPRTTIDSVNLVTTLSRPSTEERTRQSPIDLILQEVEFILNGKFSTSSYEPKHHRLSKSEYQELLERIERESTELQEFWHFKLRYDCCLRTSTFVLKMRTALHEVVVDTFKQYIEEEVKRAMQIEGACWNFTSAGGSATLEFGSDYANRQPDAAFQRDPPDISYPGLVVEVAYSQTYNILEHAARDYIEGSLGGIKTVIGIDVGYQSPTTPKGQPSSRLAKFSIWKAKSVQNGVNNEQVEVEQVVAAIPFRNADGSRAEFVDPVLLSYVDFTTQTQLPRPQEPFQISIPANILFEILASGESYEAAAKSRERMHLQSKSAKLATPPPQEPSDNDAKDSSNDDGDPNDKS